MLLLLFLKAVQQRSTHKSIASTLEPVAVGIQLSTTGGDTTKQLLAHMLFTLPIDAKQHNWPTIDQTKVETITENRRTQGFRCSLLTVT
jgi:hypothetical protein